MKDQVRRKFKQLRNDLSKSEVLEKSSKIKEKLFKLDAFRDASTILFYVSYGNEVFTHDMIKECLAAGKKIVVPISNKKNRSLILSELRNWDDLEIGSYGILEPRKECIKKFSIGEIDLIVVPGVAFDKNGNRIGHGKGYYDNLLKNSKCVSIGLAFEMQIVDGISIDENDIPVDIVITNKEIINC